MGKKSASQRRWEANKTILSEPEHRPPQPDDDDPIKVLNKMKKEQLIEYYASKYGLSPFVLSNIWDFLASQSPNKLKQLKKGNIKSTLKRTEYKNGDVLCNGKVIRNDFKLHDNKEKDEPMPDKDIDREEVVVV